MIITLGKTESLSLAKSYFTHDSYIDLYWKGRYWSFCQITSDGNFRFDRGMTEEEYKREVLDVSTGSIEELLESRIIYPIVLYCSTNSYYTHQAFFNELKKHQAVIILEIEPPF